MTEIGAQAFAGCESLSELYCLSETPPTITNDNFTNNQYMTLNVYVPQKSLEAYQNAYVWKNFWHLEGINLTGIESVRADDAEGGEECYDLGGRRLAVPRRGINVIGGRKVFVK